MSRAFALLADLKLSRSTALFLVASLLGVPAVILRVACLGKACEVRAETGGDTPYCSLPPQVREGIKRGFYDGRSPDVMAVAGRTAIVGADPQYPGVSPLWPSTELRPVEVPIVFAGEGVDVDTQVPSGTEITDISETIASIIGLERPTPDVRTGRAIEGIATSRPPRLAVEIVLKGAGSSDLQRALPRLTALRALIDEGASTMEGAIRSLPVDPAAVLTTIGTGAYPERHGVTARWMRPDRRDYESTGGKKPSNRVVEAWGPDFPGSIIATVGDHLDEELDEEPIIGLVGNEVIDRGLIGGTWYGQDDGDAVRISPENSDPVRAADEAARLLDKHGFGSDEVPDLLAVTMSGPLPKVDRAVDTLIERAREITDGSVAIVLTATGTGARPGDAETMTAAELRRSLDVETPGSGSFLEALVPGGVYVDQEQLIRRRQSDDVIVSALHELRASSGGPLMDDVFPGIAITFGRFC